ncbi:MAG: UvrB/UvrC motif-containing protein [Eubacterium sp.]|nr:UvrB/UvrC motif-containing protein [Eubacterium sp.]
MLCQHCNKNEATTHIKKNINGQVDEMHLCSKCAKELGVMEEFKMPSMNDLFANSFLGNFLGAGVAAMNSLAGVDRCHTCGSSFNDIVNSGHIGCSDCYEKFSDRLEPSIRKIHGNTKHIGKFISYDEQEEPKKTEPETESNQLDTLKQQLKDAIKEQRFEDAAVLRDKIKELTEGTNE